MLKTIGIAIVIFLIFLIGMWYFMSAPVSKKEPDVVVKEGPPVINEVVETPTVVPSNTGTLAIQVPSGITYTFHQGMDSGGNDMGHSGLADNIPALKAWCTEREACKGFNTNGWMKYTILPQAQWGRFAPDTPENANKGLFVKVL